MTHGMRSARSRSTSCRPPRTRGQTSTGTFSTGAAAPRSSAARRPRSTTRTATTTSAGTGTGRVCGMQASKSRTARKGGGEDQDQGAADLRDAALAESTDDVLDDIDCCLREAEQEQETAEERERARAAELR